MTLHAGLHVPLVTPFAADGTLDAEALAALERLAHDVLDEGAAGLLALGTTAEAATLDGAERAAVLTVLARVARERGVPLTVGAGGGDTAASRTALAALADLPEAVAALVPVPSFTRPGEAGVLAHFAALAATSPVPLLVYHIPYRTGQELSAATLREIGALPGVAGVKYAAGGVTEDTVALLGARPAGFAVLAGDDVYASALLALGAEGAVLASAHLATRAYAGLAAAWHAGEAHRARPLGHRLSRLSASLFAAPSPTVLKAVLHARGRLPSPAVRLPLLAAPGTAVKTALARLAEVEAHV
ncbi:dihydrodipicolinate synthase family protein [Streptomyces sp. NPDC047046]|uniref:dihydrodipicolinate synthase family protein n=1 Tax=Streptomyces sp. NPDC047046 TaxID=3155378 RepID=UPI0033C53061